MGAYRNAFANNIKQRGTKHVDAILYFSISMGYPVYWSGLLGA